MMIFLTVFVLKIDCFSQQDYSNYSINFEDTSQFFRIRIDTILNKNNIWQIGSPHKLKFNSAYSGINVIITDTVNSYPINDTSIFTIKHVSTGMGFNSNHTVILSGKYKIDTDSLTEFGKIEFSPDNGQTWIDLINDTVYSNQYFYYYWLTEKPILTGKINTWTDFYVNIAGFGQMFNIPYGDTVLYRFTFISDSIQTNKEGWILDDLHFEDWSENIAKLQNEEIKISLFPNPTTDYFNIELCEKNIEYDYIIYNSIGIKVIEGKNINKNLLHIKSDLFTTGIYYLKVIDKQNRKMTVKKIIID